jgi:GNAT superfamily N-acetyltransferase
MALMNRARIKAWGKKQKKDYTKDYEPETLFFFVKEGKKVVSVGGLRPITIDYLGKRYNIKGICHIIAIEKGKGYGRVLIEAIIRYLKKTNKTGLGFCGPKVTGFYEKCGLRTKKDLVERFIYINPITKKQIRDDGDGLYFEGKDKFISRVLKTKDIVYINVKHW